MKVCICGSRTITSYAIVCEAIRRSGLEQRISLVLSGCARGVDELGKQWALERNIPVKEFRADLYRWGRGAGFKRNQAMISEAEALIAVTSGSKDTAHTIKCAQEKGIFIFVYRVPPTGEKL